MKICDHCGHRNWEPREKCEACDKKLSRGGQGAGKKDGATRVPPNPDSITDGLVRGPTC